MAEVHSINYKFITLETIFLFLILVLFTSLAVAYTLLAPTFEGPDESYHYEYAVNIKNNNLPIEKYIGTSPLYYALISLPLHFLNDDSNIPTNSEFPRDKNRFWHAEEEFFPFSDTASSVHILRFFSIGTGILTLFLIYKISRLIFQNNAWLSLFTVALVATVPKFVWINSVLNSDVLVWLFSAMTILYLLKFSDNLNNKKFLILTSIFTGLGILSKANALLLVFVVISFFAYVIISKQLSIHQALMKLGLYMAITFVAGGWYLLHKILIAFDPSNVNFNNIFSLVTAAKTSPLPALDYNQVISRLFDFGLLHYRFIDMIWSNIGWHVIHASNTLMYFGEFFLVLSIGGLFSVFILKKNYLTLKFQKNHVFLIFSSVGFVLFVMLLYVIIGGTGDIRYTFPFIVAFGVLAIIGLSSFLKNNHSRLFLLIPLFILILLNLSLLSEINEKFDHGFKQYDVDIFAIVSEVYNSRPDLQKAFPEVNENNFKRLFAWAERNGVKERPILDKHEALIDLVNIYYSNPDLQKQFPEVNQQHDLALFVEWSLNNGIQDNIVPSEHKRFLVRYNSASKG